MSGRIAHAGTGHDPRLWPVLLLLLLVVLAPTACLLWLMGRAMENERLAIRQRFEDAYRRDLAGVQSRVEQSWQERVSLLERLPQADPAPTAFARAVIAGLADSVVCYDPQGRLEYPSAPARRVEVEADSHAWEEARRLEFDARDPLAAADVYAAIAARTADETIAARALQAQARCLVQSANPNDAIRLIAGPLADPKYARAADAEGRLIVANAELMALELMAHPDHESFAIVAERLRERLEDYTEPYMASTQRRFLMHELGRLWPGRIHRSLLSAEDLAARFVEIHPSPRHDANVQPSQLPEVWQFALPGRRVVALFHTSSILSQSRRAIAGSVPAEDVSVGLWPPGTDSPGGQSFLSVPAGAHLPGWQLTLTPADDRLVDATTNTRIALYGWTGMVVVVIVCLVAGLIASAFRRQLRVAQLKNDLVATVSHELKTPLSSMRLLVDTLLADRQPDPVRARQYLELMARENRRLSRLIDNFLAFSRMDRRKYSFRLAQVRLEEAIDAAVDAMRERLEQPGCRFQVEMEDPLPAVVADVDALTTAIVNLLDNACKYTGDDKRICLRAYRENGSVCIAVSDNGIGLSRAAARKVFQRFYQADRRLSRSAGGCGLGLSIVESIVEAHGGTVRVASQPDEGSTFTMRLPVE